LKFCAKNFSVFPCEFLLFTFFLFC
jgi:hypothetical protein